MIEKLREILGMISGYKQQYEAVKEELSHAEAMIVDAESIAENILAILRSWNDGASS